MRQSDEVVDTEPTITRLIFRAIKQHGKPSGPHHLASCLPGQSFGTVSRELDRLTACNLLVLENGRYWPREIKFVPATSEPYVITPWEYETPGHPGTNRVGHNNRALFTNTDGINPSRRDGLVHNVSPPEMGV